MTQLVLHNKLAEAFRVTRAAVDAATTPEATATWQPIPHGRLIDLALGLLDDAGFSIGAVEHSLTKDGRRYFGVAYLSNGVNPDDYQLAVGLRNSHDKRFPAGLAVGSRVFVCDNLAFSGEITIARKHTSRIMEDLPGLAAKAIGLLGSARDRQGARIAAYKEHPVDDRDANDFIVRAIDTKVVPVTRLPALLGEWRRPRHPEFVPRTLWSLFNAFTEVMKSTAPTDYAVRSIKLHGLADAATGLAFDPINN